MICEECCQFRSCSVLCVCDGGEKGVKRLGLVYGCTVFEKTIRCKSECASDEKICDSHLASGIQRDNGFINKVFGK
jgi:hypothetical protein